MQTVEIAPTNPISVVSTEGIVRVQGVSYSVGLDTARIGEAVGLVNKYGLVHPQDPELTGITVTIGESSGFQINKAGDPNVPLYKPNGSSNNLQVQVPGNVHHKGVQPEQALSVEQERLNRIVKAGVAIAASEGRIRRRHIFQSRAIAVAGTVLAISTGAFMAKDNTAGKAALAGGAVFAGSAALASGARLPSRRRKATEAWAGRHSDEPNLGLGPASEPDIFEFPLIYYRKA